MRSRLDSGISLRKPSQAKVMEGRFGPLADASVESACVKDSHLGGLFECPSNQNSFLTCTSTYPLLGTRIGHKIHPQNWVEIEDDASE
jgi:hypothetical protein